MKYYMRRSCCHISVRRGNNSNFQLTYPALVLLDSFTGQGTQEIYDLLEANNINSVMVPANCTDRLQLLDVSINKTVKDFFA